MRLCRRISTGEILGAQSPSPADGALLERAAVEFPEYPAEDMEEAEVTAQEYAALMAAQNAPTLEQAKAAKLAAIQAEKTRARDGGFMVNGALFDSDEAARVAYLELAMKLQADPGFSTAWKASDGVWVTMNAELFSQVYAAGANHIAACFAWQGAREAEVAAAESVAAVEQVSEQYS